MILYKIIFGWFINIYIKKNLSSKYWKKTLVVRPRKTKHINLLIYSLINFIIFMFLFFYPNFYLSNQICIITVSSNVLTWEVNLLFTSVVFHITLPHTCNFHHIFTIYMKLQVLSNISYFFFWTLFRWWGGHTVIIPLRKGFYNEFVKLILLPSSRIKQAKRIGRNQ